MKKLIFFFLLLIPSYSTATNFNFKDREIIRESVDLVELNHFYDEEGRLVFDQNIFYDWDNHAARYNVIAWRLVKSPSALPYKDWTNGGYSVFWQDGEQIRHIYAKAYKETWLQYDPELAEREYFPKEKRRELMSIQYKNKK